MSTAAGSLKLFASKKFQAPHHQHKICPDRPIPQDDYRYAPTAVPRAPPRSTERGQRRSFPGSLKSYHNSAPAVVAVAPSPPRLSYRRHRSTKPHDAPMGKRDIYFALDCEMVGVGPGGCESAVARVAVINWDGEVVIDRYVRPNCTVTDYRTHVSGVRPEDLERGGENGASTLRECREEVRRILRGKILIGHGLDNDLRALGLSHPWTDVRDTATYAPLMRLCLIDGERMLRPRKLRDLTWEKLGKQIQGATTGKGGSKGEVGHSPVEDAGAALGLYKAARMEWEVVVQERVNQARKEEDIKKQNETTRGRKWLIAA